MQPLMAQVVSTTIPFGGTEFREVFNRVVADNRELPIAKGIGAPAVFAFTSGGQLVYAGPNQTNGMQPGEAFQEIISQAIEANAAKRKRKPNGRVAQANQDPEQAAAEPPPSEKPTRELAREWTSKNGKFTLRARWVSHDATEVRLQKVDGSIIEVKIESLSAEDQEYLAEKHQSGVSAGSSEGTGDQQHDDTR